LTSNGLAVTQIADIDSEGRAVLETVLMHTSGEWIKGRLPLLANKPDPQAQGSAITYARRYSLSAIIGLCTEDDDDAERAMDRDNTTPTQTPYQGEQSSKTEVASDNPYATYLITCPEHGESWTVNKFGRRCHKMANGEWCNFSEQLKPALKVNAEKADLGNSTIFNEWVRENYDGKTWSKLSEEEQVEALWLLEKEVR